MGKSSMELGAGSGGVTAKSKEQSAKGKERAADNETTGQQTMSKKQRGKSKVMESLRPRRPHWRFEDLQIWNNACDLAVDFHRIADGLDSADFIVMRNNYAQRVCPCLTILRKDLGVFTNRNLFNFSTSRADRCSKMRPCCSSLKGSSC